MSQATPFIAKITILSSDGPYADPCGGYRFKVFALYDNSGTSSNPFEPVTSTCVMRAGAPLAGSPGATSPAVLFLPYPEWAAVNFDPTLSPALTFNYTYNPASNALTLGTPLSAYQGGTFGVFRLNFSMGDSFLYDCLSWSGGSSMLAPFQIPLGLLVNVVTPGGMFLDEISGDANLYFQYCISQGTQSVLLDFNGVDLSGENFSMAMLSTTGLPQSSTWMYADLSNTVFGANTIQSAVFDHAVMNATNFRGAFLYQVTFNGSTGTAPDFTGAICSGSAGKADFSNASFPEADFSNALLQGVHFNNGNLTNANFTGAQLQGAIFDGAILGSADFTGAHLQGTQFTNTDVTQAIFANAQFSTDPSNRTSFAGSKIADGFAGNNWSFLDLSSAFFNPRPATITNLNAQSARLCGVDFSGITFLASEQNGNPANFSNAFLANADFSNTYLNSAVFSSAHCEGESGGSFPASAAFTGANLEDALFDGAFLSGVDFSYALLWGGQATLHQATLVDTNFSNAYLASAQFTGLMDAQCGGVSFTGACLVNANFTGTTLQNGAKSGAVMFDGAFLQGTIFTQATFGSVNLGGAVLATQGGSIAVAFLTRPPGSVPGVFPINYPPTTIEPAQTTSGTTCVNGTMGPCNAAAIAPPSPMPATWTQPAH
jgi:uncharacterized protein YjbI with pentapeptide repeats